MLIERKSRTIQKSSRVGLCMCVVSGIYYNLLPSAGWVLLLMFPCHKSYDLKVFNSLVLINLNFLRVYG